MTTTLSAVVVASAFGVWLTTNPGGTWRSGISFACTRRPAARRSGVASDCTMPTTLGTVTTEATVVDVDVDAAGGSVGAGAGRVSAGAVGAVVEEPACDWLLRTSATIATTSATSAIRERRSKERAPGRPEITRARNTKSPARHAAMMPAATPTPNDTDSLWRRARAPTVTCPKWVVSRELVAIGCRGA